MPFFADRQIHRIGTIILMVICRKGGKTLIQILNWKEDFRFAGCPGDVLHIITVDSIVAWINSITADSGVLTVPGLCGQLIRPQWTTTLRLDDDEVCPDCARLLQEKQTSS